MHCADDAEGTLERVLQQQWLGGSTAERSELARAGMQVLSKLWTQRQQTRHALRLSARLAAVTLEEARLFAITVTLLLVLCMCSHLAAPGLAVTQVANRYIAWHAHSSAIE